MQVLEFLIDHQDHFVLGMSPQPASQLPQGELTAVSKPVTDMDVLEPSDSDEEHGELQVHEGGGARLMRSKTTKPKTKRYALGRSRRGNEEEGESDVDELSPHASGASTKSPVNEDPSADTSSLGGSKPATVFAVVERRRPESHWKVPRPLAKVVVHVPRRVISVQLKRSIAGS